MSDLQKTPLHGWHQEHGARLVPFAGWEMPVQYSSILEEHRAVRNAAGLFDVSHMGEVEVTGEQSERFLNQLVTNDVSRITDGQALYTVMCYPDGGCVDDLIIYRRSGDSFLICVNASNVSKDTEWMIEKAVGFECKVKNVSAQFAQLALQGPRAWDVLDALPGNKIERPGRFRFREDTVAGIPCIVSRTGYTGEDGCELYLKPEDAVAMADALLEAGQPFGLQPVGLGARDSLRLEAGFPLYGHEISAQISPIEAGLGWVVKLDKDVRCIGHDALAEQKDGGAKRKVVFFRLDDRRIAREGTDVLDKDGHKVGRVVSGSLSPMLQKPIGSAIVSLEALQTGGLHIEIRGNQIPLEVAKPPLHK